MHAKRHERQKVQPNSRYSNRIFYESFYCTLKEGLNIEMTCFRGYIHLTGWISQAVFFTYNSILFTCCLIGSSLVIYLVWSKAALQTPTYLLMSFLAISDLLTALFGQSSYCISVTFFKTISCTMEKSIAFVHATNCICSLLLLSLIARDRYLHTSKRNHYLNHTSNRFAITASITCYVSGMMVASLFMFDDRTIKISSSVVFATIGSSSFIFICRKSRQISRIVQDHSREMLATCQSPFTLDKNAYTRSSNFEKAVNRSIFSVITLFFVSWTPVIIILIIFTVHYILDEPIVAKYRIGFAWCSSVSYFNGALNPVIYGYRCDAIGREIRKIVARTLRRNRIAPPSLQLAVVGKGINKHKLSKPIDAMAASV